MRVSNRRVKFKLYMTSSWGLRQAPLRVQAEEPVPVARLPVCPSPGVVAGQVRGHTLQTPKPRDRLGPESTTSEP